MEKFCKSLRIDLFNHVIDWNSFDFINGIILKSPQLWNFLLMFCNLSLYKHIWIHLLFNHKIDNFRMLWYFDNLLLFNNVLLSFRELLVLSINYNLSKLFKGLINHEWLINLMPLFSFYTPWKHHKTRGFLMFSGSTERGQWHERD